MTLSSADLMQSRECAVSPWTIVSGETAKQTRRSPLTSNPSPGAVITPSERTRYSASAAEFAMTVPSEVRRSRRSRTPQRGEVKSFS